MKIKMVSSAASAVIVSNSESCQARRSLSINQMAFPSMIRDIDIEDSLSFFCCRVDIR